MAHPTAPHCREWPRKGNYGVNRQPGKAPGRGAYLCRSEECIKAELKKCQRLSKGLRRALTSEEIEELAKEMLEAADV